MKLTTVILNHHHQDISLLLRSVSFSDEIIILYDTATLTRKYRAFPQVRELARPLGGNFSAQRNFGLAKARGDWVLFVDSDELITHDLASEIISSLGSLKYSGYYLGRIDNYYQRFLRHGETGNIKLLRLARRKSGLFVRPVHEFWQVSGPVGSLSNSILHLRVNLVTGFLDRMAFYGKLDSRALNDEGKPFSYFRLIVNPKAKFIYNYLFRLGFLDGYLGLFHAYLMSIQSLSVRINQWEQGNT